MYICAKWPLSHFSSSGSTLCVQCVSDAAKGEGSDPGSKFGMGCVTVRIISVYKYHLFLIC